MDKKKHNLRNRSRHQDLSESSDETLCGDLEPKIRLPVNRKRIFSPGENIKVKLRPSVFEKNMGKFVSSTPMCSKKRFSSSLCISPIENDESPVTRLRRRSTSLQKHVVSSTSDGVHSNTSNNENNPECFVNNKSDRSYRKKGTVHSNRKIFSHDSIVNKTQVESSLLAQTLPSLLNYSENENEILMKSTQLNNDKKKSKESRITQTSFQIAPRTVTKKSILTQTGVDKETQITDSLKKQTAVNQNHTVTNDSDGHECTLTNLVNLSKNNEKTRKSKDMSLTCMCHSVNNVEEIPKIDEKWLPDLLARNLNDEISDKSDVTYKSDSGSIQSWQRKPVVVIDRCNVSQLEARYSDSSKENSPSKDFPSAVYNESGNQGKVGSSKKRKSNVSIETTKRKRSMLINDDEISASSASGKKNNKTRKTSKRNQKTKETSKKNRKTKQRQPIKDIETALEVVEDDTQSRGEGFRRSTRIRKEIVRHYELPLLYTWDKKVAEDTKKNSMLYAPYGSQISKIQELCETEKPTRTKKMSQKNADNGLSEHLVNISNNDRCSNKSISESLKGKLEIIQHTETSGNSGCIQRDYFYFPQNNGVHKFNWCTSFPNLDKVDENGCLRIGRGIKSFQSGCQSGYLEISPGESKPRDMLKKFSMLFTILSGVAEFEVHDSYQILHRWSSVSVPLGAYYCIRNKSNSENLLLWYVKIEINRIK